MAEPVRGYVAQSADTDEVADRIQFDIYRSWSHAKKLQAIMGLCRAGRELSLTGLRLRHPKASEEELFLREAALRLGEDLTRRVYGARYDEFVR